jgi:hypothetical protein
MGHFLGHVQKALAVFLAHFAEAITNNHRGIIPLCHV